MLDFGAHAGCVDQGPGQVSESPSIPAHSLTSMGQVLTCFFLLAHTFPFPQCGWQVECVDIAGGIWQ